MPCSHIPGRLSHRSTPSAHIFRKRATTWWAPAPVAIGLLGTLVIVHTCYFGELPWTEHTYTIELVTTPCAVVDVSVLGRYSDASADMDERKSDIHSACDASAIPDNGLDAAGVKVSATVVGTRGMAGSLYESDKNRWTNREDDGFTGGELPNLGQDAYFAFLRNGTGKAMYQIGVLDDNMKLEVSMWVMADTALSPDDIDHIRRTVVDHVRRAMDLYRR